MGIQELFCETKTEEVCPVVFCLGRFQVAPLPSWGLLVPLQHLEGGAFAWDVWLGMSLKLRALPPSHPVVFEVCLWCVAHKFQTEVGVESCSTASFSFFL